MKDQNEKDNSITLIVIVISVITVIVMSWIYTYSTLKPLEETTRGTFGDMFGGLNALFSGFAFGGIILTIFLQSRELSLQRDELRDTREEFKVQNFTLSLQRFENTFFSSIELLHNILNNYTETKSEVTSFGQYPYTINGRDVLKIHGERLSVVMSTDGDLTSNFYSEYKFINIQFEHYFRNLLNIIQSIHDFKIEDDNIGGQKVIEIKMKYIEILKSNLNQYDFLWLFYYCLVIDTKSRNKALLETYSFFSDINLMLINNFDHMRYYSNNAYRSKYE